MTENSQNHNLESKKLKSRIANFFSSSISNIKEGIYKPRGTIANKNIDLIDIFMAAVIIVLILASLILAIKSNKKTSNINYIIERKEISVDKVDDWLYIQGFKTLHNKDIAKLKQVNKKIAEKNKKEKEELEVINNIKKTLNFSNIKQVTLDNFNNTLFEEEQVIGSDSNDLSPSNISYICGSFKRKEDALVKLNQIKKSQAFKDFGELIFTGTDYRIISFKNLSKDSQVKLNKTYNISCTKSTYDFIIE